MNQDRSNSAKALPVTKTILIKFDDAWFYLINSLENFKIEEAAIQCIFHDLIHEVLYLDQAYPPTIDYLEKAIDYLSGVYEIGYERASYFCTHVVNMIMSVVSVYLPEFSSEVYHGKISYEIVSDFLVRLFVIDNDA